MSSKCARLTGYEEVSSFHYSTNFINVIFILQAPWKFYLYFFNARFPFLTVHRSLSSRLDLPVSLPSSICSKTSALKGNYELIHKQFDKRKAYYIWTYHSEVDGKRNPDVTPAARARHKHFMMIDPMNKPLKVCASLDILPRPHPLLINLIAERGPGNTRHKNCLKHRTKTCGPQSNCNVHIAQFYMSYTKQRYRRDIKRVTIDTQIFMGDSFCRECCQAIKTLVL